MTSRNRGGAYWRRGMGWVAMATLGVLAGAAGLSAQAGVGVRTAVVGTKAWNSPAQGGNGDYVFIDAPAAQTHVSGITTVSGRAGRSDGDPNGGTAAGYDRKPQVVIAMIDTGANPYHVDFRDPERLVSPATYLTGFPSTAKAAPLCFIDDLGGGRYRYRDDCSGSWQANVVADGAVVNAIAEGDLVWYPGTRIMTKSFAHTDTNSPVGFDQGGGDSGTSHGSWVSSAAVGNTFGTCPDCLLIALEADTVDAIEAAYQWAAQQPWIDVITSSISIGILGVGVNTGLFPAQHDGAVAASRNGKLFLSAAGNGAANFGLVPTSTFLLDSGSPAVIPVGASFDDGLATHWSDFPAEIMANGSSRRVADTASMSGEITVSGTSFSSPAAAGVLAHSLLEARRACNDTEEGASVAAGDALTLLRNRGCTVTAGPFADGILTRDELHEAFVKNAVPPYAQLSPVPGPVGWVKNAYGYVDLGNGLRNGGATIQPFVTASILGTRPVPVRSLEQFWYDGVVREAQSAIWGPRPTVDGDGDGFPRDDGACMPVCAPTELQRYVGGLLGLDETSSFQSLLDLLGVNAATFMAAGTSDFNRFAERGERVAGVAGEVGAIRLSNDATHLTVRLALSGMLDGLVPTVRSNPISYEVTFTTAHNGTQNYRLAYEFEAADVLALLEGRIPTPLTDKFQIFVDSAPNAQGLSSICPIDTDLSASTFDVDTNEAVWVIPLSAFNHDNRPTDCAAFTRGGRALAGGDIVRDIQASAVLTVGIINFGDGLGFFGTSEADDYMLTSSGPGDADGDGVPDASDRCPATPSGTPVDAEGCPLGSGSSVSLRVNGVDAGQAGVIDGHWSRDIDFSQFTPVNGEYVVEARFGTATDTVVLRDASAPGALRVTLTASYSKAANADGTYTVSESDPLEVTLSAVASGGPGSGYRYTFYFGDNSYAGPQAEATATHLYRYGNVDGYRVKVVVTDADATQSAVSEEIVIRTVSPVVVNGGTVMDLVVTPTSGTAPLTVTVDANGPDASHDVATASTVYRFDFGDGTVVENTTGRTSHVYTRPEQSVYTITATMTDLDASGNELGTSTATAMVAVNSGNTLTALLAVRPTLVRIGDPVTFDGCASFAPDGETIVRYVFDPDGAGPLPAVDRGGECTFEYAYTAAGTYTPTLTVTDSAGATAKAAARGVEVRPGVESGNRRKGGGALGLMAAMTLLLLAAARRRHAGGQGPF